MTTFTTEDRITAEQNGSVTITVEPIPFAGMVTIIEYKDLTDVEIYEVFEACVFEGGFSKYEFARAILKKAGEK